MVNDTNLVLYFDDLIREQWELRDKIDEQIEKLYIERRNCIRKIHDLGKEKYLEEKRK